MNVVPVLVRANSSPPFRVEKMAHGSLVEANVTPRPACWNRSPEKFAVNSSVCGAVNVADCVTSVVSGRQLPLAPIAQLATRAPSTSSTPSTMIAEPPGLPGPSIQPGDSDGPVNSVAEVGASISSPSAVCDTYVPPADAPAAKSDTEVSRSVGPGTVKVGAGIVVVLPE